MISFALFFTLFVLCFATDLQTPYEQYDTTNQAAPLDTRGRKGVGGRPRKGRGYLAMGMKRTRVNCTGRYHDTRWRHHKNGVSQRGWDWSPLEEYQGMIYLIECAYFNLAEC